jgi:hypothetical protein
MDSECSDSFELGFLNLIENSFTFFALTLGIFLEVLYNVCAGS